MLENTIYVLKRAEEKFTLGKKLKGQRQASEEQWNESRSELIGALLRGKQTERVSKFWRVNNGLAG